MPWTACSTNPACFDDLPLVRLVMDIFKDFDLKITSYRKEQKCSTAFASKDD